LPIDEGRLRAAFFFGEECRGLLVKAHLGFDSPGIEGA